MDDEFLRRKQGRRTKHGVCAILATLNPGSYTVVLRGLNRSIGTALFELYDLDPQKSKIANISTRRNVGIGDNIMIGGFIVGGDQPTNVIVRALDQR